MGCEASIAHDEQDVKQISPTTSKSYEAKLESKGDQTSCCRQKNQES